MNLQGQLQSKGEKKKAVADGDDEEDLNQLARQTLSGVKPNLLPPEPFPSGFDLSALASSSRSTRPPPAPAASDDASDRIDLRALAQSASPPAVQSKPPPATLPPRKRSGAREMVPSAAPPALVAPVAQAGRELDDLIASRGFAPGSQAAQALAIIRRAPAWSWVVAAGVAVGIVVASGSDEAAQPAVAAAAASASASTSAASPTLPLAATSLPQIAAAPQARTGSARIGSTASGLRRAPGRDVRAAPEPTTAAPAPVDPGSAEDRTIDTLLDQAIGGRALPTAAPAAPAPRTDPNLPELPARDTVATVLGGVQPRIRFCAGDRAGVATASIVVKNDGRVTSARINGAPFSRTAAGRCMESVLRGVRFPKFAKPTFRVTYPFQI